MLKSKKDYENNHYQEVLTFWHECIHGISDSLLLGLTEEQVSLLAVGTLAVIRDNKLDLNT